MRQLVLLGSGPAHLRLLARLSKQLPQGAQTDIKITLVSRNQQHIDAPLCAGFIAGRWPLDKCLVDLEPLVQATQSQWIEAQAVALDPKAQVLGLADGQEIRYDWLSINLEPVQSRELAEQQMPGATANGLFIRPALVFCKLWPSVLELAATKALRIAVVCNNPSAPANPAQEHAVPQENAAIELALSINQALPHCATTLITGGAPLANASSASTRQLLAKTLKRQKITVLADAATAIKPSEIILASGARLACDVPVLAIAANPPALAAASALALDAQGFVAVDSNSRSISHPNVLAVPDSDLLGDTLAQLLTEATGLPLSSGSRNGAGRLSKLQFVASAQGHAIASWGSYSTTGRVSAWVKQLVDQQRMASYRVL